MTNEERIAANAAKGYILVYSGDGFEMHKKKDENGFWTYYSDSVTLDYGALPIFNTACMSKEEFIAIGKDAFNLKINE